MSTDVTLTLTGTPIPHTTRLDCLDKGHIELLGVLGSDEMVVQAARASTNRIKTNSAKRIGDGLIHRLLRDGHKSPFFHPHITIVVKAPLFVMRQWMRSNVGWAYNEQSQRYAEVEPEFYIPDTFLRQVGKPMDYRREEVTDATMRAVLRDQLEQQYQAAFQTYKYLSDGADGWGLALEQARVVLPTATYTTVMATCSLYAALHFIALRGTLHAQFEIRQYAEALAVVVKENFPVTWEAFVAYGLKEA